MTCLVVWWVPSLWCSILCPPRLADAILTLSKPHTLCGSPCADTSFVLFGLWCPLRPFMCLGISMPSWPPLLTSSLLSSLHLEAHPAPSSKQTQDWLVHQAARNRKIPRKTWNLWKAINLFLFYSFLSWNILRNKTPISGSYSFHGYFC